MRYLTTGCALALLAGRLAAAPYHAITHEFVAIDEGLDHLMYVNEKDPAKHWVVTTGQQHPRDLQLVGHGRVLLGHDAGYTEYDLATGEAVKTVAEFHDVSSVRRLSGGHTLIVGVDFDQPLPPGKRKSIKVVSQIDPSSNRVIIGEYDADGKSVRRTVYPGDYSRLMRQTPQGNYLLACNDIVKELSPDGKVVWTARTKEFLHAWKALRLPDGNTLVAGGYGAVMVEFDPKGEVVRKFGLASQLDPVFHPFFYATFQVLAGGDVVAANWQGHGPKHGNEGVQLVEFDPEGKIVWSWSDKPHISSLQAILVLDGLDPSKIYDERGGVMEPLEGQ